MVTREVRPSCTGLGTAWRAAPSLVPDPKEPHGAGDPFPAFAIIVHVWSGMCTCHATGRRVEVRQSGRPHDALPQLLRVDQPPDRFTVRIAPSLSHRTTGRPRRSTGTCSFSVVRALHDLDLVANRPWLAGTAHRGRLGILASNPIGARWVSRVQPRTRTDQATRARTTR